MKKKKNLTKRFERKPVAKALALLGLCAISPHALAIQGLDGASSPWTPRVTAQGLFGNEQQGAGFIDALVPLKGDDRFLWFLDGTYTRGHDKPYVASVGTGVRKLIDTQKGAMIVGGFIFGDKTKTRYGGQTWFVNPGVEALSSHYEVRVQGYIPATRRQAQSQATLASMVPQHILSETGLSIDNFAFGRGHNFFDTPVVLTQEFGPGIEAEVGRFLPFMQGGWVRAGVYHFNFRRTKDITGVEANVELFTKGKVSLIFQDNYDNQNKNKFSLGVRLTFGGPDYRKVDELSNRMEEPIIRHIARQSYGEGAPSRQGFEPVGPTQVTLTNVWFFSPNGVAPPANNVPFTANGVTFANCTAENPCNNINQATVNGINALAPGANLFFASGTYNLPANSMSDSNAWLNLFNGQTFWGRTSGFSQAATGGARPLINGGLFWGNESLNTKGNGAVYNMRITNQDQLIPISVTGFSTEEVIGVGAFGSINVFGSTVSATAIGPVTDTVFGVFGDDNATVTGSTVSASLSGSGGTGSVTGVLGGTNTTVTGSTINASGSASGGGSGNVNGVSGGFNTTVTGSTVSATGSATGVGASGNVTGVLGGFSTTVTGSSISASGTATGDGSSGSVTGVFGALTTTVTGSTITSTGSATGAGASGSVFGVFGGGGDTTVTGNSISATGSATGSGYVYGVFGGDNTTVTGSTISAIFAGSSGTVVGVYGVDNTTVTGSTVSASATGLSGTVFGVRGDNNTTVTGSSISASLAGSGTVFGVFGEEITVSGSTVSANHGGAGLALGVFGEDNTTVTGSMVSASASGAGGSAIGVGGNDITTVSGSTVSASSAGGSATGVAGATTTVTGSSISATTNGAGPAIGVAGNTTTVSGSTVSATATGAGDAIGVSGISGTVTTTNIEVNGSGVKAKCSPGVTSSDGSCD
jgi:hypothetical protein